MARSGARDSQPDPTSLRGPRAPSSGAGVDWSDNAFATVGQIELLYRSDNVALVHGVDLGMLQSPLMAGAINLQGHDEFRQAIERCGTLLPADIPSIRACSGCGGDRRRVAAFFRLVEETPIESDLYAAATTRLPNRDRQNFG